jgi:hypothetical protein
MIQTGSKYHGRNRCSVGVEVLSAVTVKSTVFWIVMSCSSETSQCLRETYLELKDKATRNQQE